MKNKLRYFSAAASVVLNAVLLWVFFLKVPFRESFGTHYQNLFYGVGNKLYQRFATGESASASTYYLLTLLLCIAAVAVVLFAAALTVSAARTVTELLRRRSVKTRVVFASVWSGGFLAAALALFAVALTAERNYSDFIYLESVSGWLIWAALFLCISCLLPVAASAVYQLFAFWKRKSEKSFRAFLAVAGCIASLAFLLTAVSFAVHSAFDFKDHNSFMFPVYICIAVLALVAFLACVFTVLGAFTERPNRGWAKACAVCALIFAFLAPPFIGAAQLLNVEDAKCLYGGGVISTFYDPVDFAAANIGVVRLGLTGSDYVCARSQSDGRRIYVAKNDIWESSNHGDDRPELFGQMSDDASPYDRLIDGKRYRVSGAGLDYGIGFSVYIVEPAE